MLLGDTINSNTDNKYCSKPMFTHFEKNLKLCLLNYFSKIYYDIVVYYDMSAHWVLCPQIG